MCLKTDHGTIELSESHPVPEYRASDLYMHQLAREFHVNPYKYDSAMNSSGYGFKGFDTGNRIYVRDYFPLQIKAKRNGVLKPVFIKYLTFTNDGRPFHFLAPHQKGKKPGENYEFLIHDQISQKLEFWAESKTLPLIMEGGNIIQTPSHVFTTRKIIEVNMKTEADIINSLANGNKEMELSARKMMGNAKEAGWKQRSAEEVTDLLAKSYEIRPEQVVVLESMPFERTRHVDMFMSHIGPGAIAMPYIKPSTAKLANRNAKEIGELNAWLAKQEKTFKDLGYEVLKVPMLPPENFRTNAEGKVDATFLSPVNWVIKGEKVLVPDFLEAASGYPKAEYESIRAEITNSLKERGYAVEFVDVSRLAKTNGSLHCITAQYDLSEFHDLREKSFP